MCYQLSYLISTQTHTDTIHVVLNGDLTVCMSAIRHGAATAQDYKNIVHIALYTWLKWNDLTLNERDGSEVDRHSGAWADYRFTLWHLLFHSAHINKVTLVDRVAYLRWRTRTIEILLKDCHLSLTVRRLSTSTSFISMPFICVDESTRVGSRSHYACAQEPYFEFSVRIMHLRIWKFSTYSRQQRRGCSRINTFSSRFSLSHFWLKLIHYGS